MMGRITVYSLYDRFGLLPIMNVDGVVINN